MVEAVDLISCWRFLFIALTFSDNSFLMVSFSSVSELVVLDSELSVCVKKNLTAKNFEYSCYVVFSQQKQQDYVASMM